MVPVPLPHLPDDLGRLPLLLAVAAALVTAGCLGASEDGPGAAPSGSGGGPGGDQGADRDSSGASTNATAGNDTERRTLYTFQGRTNGTTPPHPRQPGAVGGRAPTMVETVRVPPNATDVLFLPDTAGGAGRGRVEFVAPNGSLVAATKTHTIAGTCQGPFVRHSLEDLGGHGDATEPGPYEVRYYVAGSICWDVTVMAELPR